MAKITILFYNCWTYYNLAREITLASRESPLDSCRN